MVTSNKIKAAPVEISIKNSKNGRVGAVVITSGNANAFTGEGGHRDAMKICELVSRGFGIKREEVIVNSTGIIGQRLDMSETELLVNEATESLRRDGQGILGAADAIKTTDAFRKMSSKTIKVGGGNVRVTGFAKGAGMIAPKLMHATMICVLLTDAYISNRDAQFILKNAVDKSFNRVIVDGDMSTNDMVVLLASGKAGNKGVDSALQGAVDQVCLDLAKMIVRDGEGATKLLTVEVWGAASEKDAVKAARSIAGSTLVKTALFGENPNWGRVVAAVGYSGADFDKTKLSVSLLNDDSEVALVENGVGLALKGSKEIQEAARILKSREISFRVGLGVGESRAYAYGCDLGYNYVKVNAEYTT